MSRNDDLVEHVVLAEEVLGEDDDDIIMTGTVLLAALRVGPNIIRLSEYCGVSRYFVREISRHMRTARLWEGKAMYLGSWEHDLGFVIDVLVACGMVTVKWKEGKPLFSSKGRLRWPRSR